MSSQSSDCPDLSCTIDPVQLQKLKDSLLAGEISISYATDTITE